MDALIGHSGFVGGNLMRQHGFEALFNSKNIDDIAGQGFGTMVISAVPATMWLANKNPEADRANILALFERLAQAKAQRAVVISTIAVYRDASRPVDENSDDYEADLAYGRHRREFETLIADAFADHLILRLPALFGAGLKKNFLFDLMNPVPSFLKPDVFDDLLAASGGDRAIIEQAFTMDEAAGMWKFDRPAFTGNADGARIRSICDQAGISALAFTHADSHFQFYDLSHLWADIARAREHGISTLNLATEPLSAGAIHAFLTGRDMPYRSAPRVMQDMRSAHARHWGRSDGYLAGHNDILAGIRTLVEGQV